MTNDTTNASVTNAMVDDDVSDVLDNANIVETPAELAARGLVLTGTTLTWTVASLAPGATIEVTYQVLIAAHQWGVTLRNVATPAPGPGECVKEGDCETTTTTPPVTTLVVEKQDLDTHEVLAGATFQLWLDNDNAGQDPETGDCTFPTPPVVGAEDDLLDTQVTGANGRAQFGELRKGCYLLVESKAPPGYDLPAPNVMGVALNKDNFVAGGVMSPIVVTDFAQGQIAIVAKRQFENCADLGVVCGSDPWIESDGLVAFGQQVLYRLAVVATGPKLFHNVTLTDYVPGFNPADTTSTVDATLVAGSPKCTGALVCTISVGKDNLITFSAGTLHEASGGIEFIVTFPQPPEPTPFVNNTYTAMLWNQGYIAWNEVTGAHSRASNAVVVRATITQATSPTKVLPSKASSPTRVLPRTGAPNYLEQLADFGFLTLALGLAMTILGRRKQEREA
jgi:Prealbumin-like fold domain